ncbi:MAG: response regulator [Xenococcaceae cyanobacterium]
MIRILIADDANLIRQALNIYFKVESDLEIVGTAANGKTALKLVGELNPDIVLMDMEMPEMDGLTATQIIRKCFPQTKILVISGYNSQDYVAKALKAGANGYFIKSTPAEELSEAIRLIHEQDVKIIPARSSEKSYRVLPTSLIKEEDAELTPELLLQTVYAREGNQKRESEQVCLANHYYPSNSLDSSITNSQVKADRFKFPSFPLSNSKGVLNAIRSWKHKKKITLVSLVGISIFLGSVIKHKTTVEATAEVRTNPNVLATIASDRPNLLVKASVTARDINKIETDQKVQLKVFGCPYHYYGTLEGKTVAISHKSSPLSENKNFYMSDGQLQGASGSDSFEVTIEPASLFLYKDRHKCNLKSGMKAKADIVTQEETILAFLLRKARSID